MEKTTKFLILIVISLAILFGCTVQPTPTSAPTPDIPATVSAAVKAALPTATLVPPAACPTPLPPPTSTVAPTLVPNTPTPTAGPTSTAMPSPTPQPTPKPPATVEAVVGATIAAIAPTTAAPTATPRSPTPTPFRATPTPRRPIVWQEVDRWTGDFLQTTTHFRVRADEWRITWTTQPGELAFKINLHNSNRELKTVVIDKINPEPNSLVFLRDGDRYDYNDFYLVIIGYQPYTVIVEELIR
jgi:hypothetical protein